MEDSIRGLYRKYYVKRLNDPEEKHIDCNYFVLDMNHDKYAKAAVSAYADSCRKDYPNLARDLKLLVETK